MKPPVDFFVQGSRVRTHTRREREPLHVMMMVLVDMQEGPVYLEQVREFYTFYSF